MLQPGELIDIWVVEKALGTGGMGSVYRCHNRTATRILAAVKVLDSSLRRISGAEERFIREAEILFRVDHPNIVKVRNVRTDTDPPYLEMEFVEGESLEHRLQRGALPIGHAVDLMRQLADAVAYLHEQGIRHRDIKPANLLIKGENKLKLVDFGLAMEADHTRITQSGMTFGTVSYAPPEWVTPDQLDPVRWDVYAMGVVMWEMLTGQVAFPVSGHGSARQQAMQVILAKQTAPPLDPGPAFHEPLRQLIREMTSARPEERPATARDVFHRAAALEPTLARPTGQTLVAAAYVEDDSDEAPPYVGPRTWDEELLKPGQTPAPGPARAEGGGDGLAVATDAAPAPATSVPDGTLRPRMPVAPPKAPDTTDAPETARPARARWPIVVGLVAAAGVVGVVGLVGAVAAWQLVGASAAPAARGVEVVVSGLPSGSPVELRLAGAPAASRDDLMFRFAGVPVGDAEVRWAVGEGCAPCLDGGDCPVWCGTDAASRAIEAGSGAQVLALAIEPPPRRSVRLEAAALPDGVSARFIVDGRVAEGIDARNGRLELAPGRYEVLASAGTCPADAAGCGDGAACPPGCVSVRRELVLPWGTGEHTAAIELPAPARPVAAPPPVATKATAPERPVVATVTAVAAKPEASPAGTGRASRVVTQGDFAKWLAKHPEWMPGTAPATQADANYLSGWTGATPAGAAGEPVVNVSWYAAAAYCTTRGGLAAIDAEPLTWTEGPGQPGIEWRTAGGKAAWRDASGITSDKVRKNESNALTGFRCAR